MRFSMLNFDFFVDRLTISSVIYSYLIMQSDKLAGFVLVRKIAADCEPPKFSIAEFFILKKYRKRGIGKESALKVI
ncbi:GNAT family N-acetyltransferase [Paenibacillus cineris]|uniref:GNAT family N-acetyltransferase n=1 Tax=Paenibacillus cineris TaxID=237530 RepID=UPI002795434A|nr:GNAT family N-acetyltransferase [Paenibacillus cineris]